MLSLPEQQLFEQKHSKHYYIVRYYSNINQQFSFLFLNVNYFSDYSITPLLQSSVSNDSSEMILIC